MVADCPNYIKGYRYQLWCEAKAAGTRCCVVHVAAQEEECKTWNNERLKAWGRGTEVDDNKQAPHAPKGSNTALGELNPESHTAIYGDRVTTDTRSRSSSMDGTSDREPSRQQDDTMTLKSLYISDNAFSSMASTSTTPIPHQPPLRHQPFPFIPSTPIPSSASTPPYSPTTLSSLLMRYEPPSPFSRWDTPLFTVPSTDAHPPYTGIWDAIFPPPTQKTSKKALSQLSSKATNATSQNPTQSTPVDSSPATVKQHLATILPTSTSSDALQILEATTLEIVRAFLAKAREISAADGDGGIVSFAIPVLSSKAVSKNATGHEVIAETGSTALDMTEVEIVVPAGTSLNQPMLQRLRRQYTQIQRGSIAHGRGYVSGRVKIVEGFVSFLDAGLGGE